MVIVEPWSWLVIGYFIVSVCRDLDKVIDWVIEKFIEAKRIEPGESE